ncbi:MAG: helix-turn-helix transcriptional regulator [Clostridiales bacterium]|nr:helix-turn-helix transcriptional regulator [Clostridiales bacterium]
MYEIFEKLCEMRGITPYKFCKEMEVNSSTISTWKKNNSMARPDLAKKVCDFFGVSLDYLMTGKEPEEKKPELTPKDERDIAKKLSATLDQLEANDGLMFDGEALDDETKELLKISLENAIRTAKITAKKKFTPKKYK